MSDFDHSSLFAGLTVLVTGDLPSLSRSQAQAKIVELGGKPVGSVSGSTGLVVIGEGAGVSKMVKIRRHDLQIISGVDFEALVLDPVNHPAADSVLAGGRLGVPCSVWEADRGGDEPDEDEPFDPTPWSERHLVGQASGPPRDGGRGVEYRMWCLKCGENWVGKHGSFSINRGCPNDPNSRNAQGEP